MAFTSRVKKAIRNVGSRVKRFAKKRYGARNPNAISNMKHDIQLVKSLINVEKKRFDITNTNIAVPIGQCFQATASGHFLFDATPLPTSGVGYSQRTGASIKLYSSFLKFQFAQQASTTIPVKLVIDIFINKGETIATSPATGEVNITPLLYQSNPWVKASAGADIYDFHSSRKMDNIKNWTLLRSKKLTISPDPTSSVTMVKEFSFGIKYKKGFHTKFDKDTANCVGGQIVCVVRADVGNCSNATASTLSSVTFTAVSTGATMKYNVTHYYIDN